MRSPALRRVIQTGRAARLLRPAAPLCARQAARGPARSYRLRRTRQRVHVRHGSRDLDILTEIFGRGTYTPPPGVPLNGPIRVLDVGGNIGMFGLYALHHWNVSSLRSYEPDQANAQLLEGTAEPFPAWNVVRAAVSNQNGTLEFRDGLLSESRMALPGEPSITVPTVDLFNEPAADLIKLDVEGGEWVILTDPRLPRLPARVIVMEWHKLGCPHHDPARFAGELLRNAGYINQHRGEECDHNGLLWAWRQ